MKTRFITCRKCNYKNPFKEQCNVERGMIGYPTPSYEHQNTITCKKCKTEMNVK